MHKITVNPGNKIIEVNDQANLRDALISNGVEVKSTCGGCASCADCVVIIKDGHDNLNEINFEEKQLLGNVYHLTQERLSCQTEVMGDISVDVSAHLPRKTPPKTIRKTKEDIEQSASERTQEDRPAREGGFRKPRAFNFDDDK